MAFELGFARFNRGSGDTSRVLANFSVAAAFIFDFHLLASSD